jgi:hypothetical protein
MFQCNWRNNNRDTLIYLLTLIFLYPGYLVIWSAVQKRLPLVSKSASIGILEIKFSICLFEGHLLKLGSQYAALGSSVDFGLLTDDLMNSRFSVAGVAHGREITE